MKRFLFILFLGAGLAAVTVAESLNALDLKHMTLRQVFDTASQQIVAGRTLSPADLATLKELQQKYHDSGDETMELRTEALRDVALTNHPVPAQVTEKLPQESSLWHPLRDASLAVTLASAASSLFFFAGAQTAGSTPYNQRLVDADKLGAGISLTTAVLAFLALLTSESHL